MLRKIFDLDNGFMRGVIKKHRSDCSECIVPCVQPSGCYIRGVLIGFVFDDA